VSKLERQRSSGQVSPIRSIFLSELVTYRSEIGDLARPLPVNGSFVAREKAYRAQNNAAILAVAARQPEAVPREDRMILMYYGLA
jgi:hypothetical protein